MKSECERCNHHNVCSKVNMKNFSFISVILSCVFFFLSLFYIIEIDKQNIILRGIIYLFSYCLFFSMIYCHILIKNKYCGVT